MPYRFNFDTGKLDFFKKTSPGGLDTQVQFNDSGIFGGDSSFTFNKTTNVLTLGGRFSQIDLGFSTLVGFEAGLNDDLTNNKNSAFGYQALKSATTGFENVMIGYQTGDAITTGSSNIGIGSPALNNLTTGQGNVAIGDDTLGSATDSVFSTAVGNAALTGQGNHSSAFGNSALAQNNNGDFNVGVGSNALVNNTTGDSNIAIGYFAGALKEDGTPLTLTASSIYIGASSRGLNNSDSFSIVIGAAAQGIGANTTVIGRVGTTKALMYGNHTFYSGGAANIQTDNQIGVDSGAGGIPMFLHSAAGAAAVEAESAAVNGTNLIISGGFGGDGAVDAISADGASVTISSGYPGADGGLGVGVAGSLDLQVGFNSIILLGSDGNVTVAQNMRINGRLLKTQGVDVASANNLTLGSDGNTFEITGATQINAITTSGWLNGSEVNLLFTSTPTVKHNTAGGAGTAVMLLAGSVDAAMTAGSRLKLLLSEIGGTQAWREMSRTFV